MTEHKMTAKKVLDANTANGSRMDETRVLNAMKEFALQVATEAVEDETESYDRGFGKHAAEMHGESILKNIKKLLNDE